jgi:hypothetical protein
VFEIVYITQKLETMKTTKRILLLTTVLMVLATSCKKEQVDPQTHSNTGEPGTFKVYMTDSPANYDSLDLEIVRVEAYLENSGWVTLNSEAQSFDVLTLTNGTQTELAAQTKGQARIGTYSFLKIVFGSNNQLTLNATAAFQALGLSGTANALVGLRYEGDHEVILAIDEQVSANVGAEVLVDFDVAQSIYQEGREFVIEPVLSVIADARTGVRGHVEGAAHAMVQISQGADSLSTYINASGDFLIRGASQGTYEMNIVPAQPSPDMPSPHPYHVQGLVITEGKITNVGTISF